MNAQIPTKKVASTTLTRGDAVKVAGGKFWIVKAAPRQNITTGNLMCEFEGIDQARQIPATVIIAA